MVESCVRGFHVYQDIWTPTAGERFPCETEDSNANDPYAVAVKKGVQVIEHVPRKISAACCLFIQTVFFRSATGWFTDSLQAGV